MRRALPAIVCVISVLAIVIEALTGGQASRKLGLDPVADAATRSLDEKTAQVEMVMRRGSERFVLTGVMDIEHGRGDVRGSMSGAGELHEILSGSTVYVDVPEAAQAMNGRHWLKIDVKKLLKKLGAEAAGKLFDSSSDPTTPLEQLAQAGLDAQLVGKSHFRGEPATKYHVEFTFAQFVNTLPPEQAEAMRALQAKTQVGERVVEDIWIDGHNRVRRLAMGYDQAGTHVSERFDFVRYGVPVHVATPPDDETIDALDALEKAGVSLDDLASGL